MAKKSFLTQEIMTPKCEVVTPMHRTFQYIKAFLWVSSSI